MAELYILHFDKPYWRDCQHYVGYTKYTAQTRCDIHRGINKNGGTPSKLVRYALANGVDFTIAYVEKFESEWRARAREKQLKKGGHLSRICSICRKGK